MEQWKAIPGYEGIYEASNLGRIRSAEGKTTSGKSGIIHWKQRVIKQHYQARRSGLGKDARVALWKDKQPHYYLVSRLIAKTWCDGFTAGMTVNHIDGNPLNNNADNLEWISRADNIRKAFDDGLFSTQKTVTLVDDKGCETQFRSMASASRFLGKSNGYISNLLAKGISRTNDGYAIII